MANRFYSYLLLVLFFLTTFGPRISAIPAYPHRLTVRQPDGSTLTIRLQGDEHGYLAFTADGYPLCRNAHTGWIDYACVDDHGNICPCGLAAADEGSRDKMAISYLSEMDVADITSRAILPSHPIPRTSLPALQSPRKIRISDFPTIGTQRSLIVLVEFADMKFTTVDDPYTYYYNMLNAEGFTHENGANGSARDFYLASSFGLFDPRFDVVGPVQLPHDHDYYGANSTQMLDTLTAQMVVDACCLADADVDFSQYDADGDGYVDNIYFFYAGYGEADSYMTDAIWPHAGTLEGDWQRSLRLDDINISRYACSNEIRYSQELPLMPVGIGTFVHEFGHVLGLVDHYDTMQSSGRIGVQEWDTMAAASYHDNQNTPPTFSAFERAELGWLSYTDISPDEEGLLKLKPLLIGNQAYKINVPDTDGREYFIVENRQLEGWDRTLPGHGLLVWHVDMDEEAWLTNHVNIDPIHQRLDLVEADGIESAANYASDPFPGLRAITSFEFTDWMKERLFAFDWVEETDTTANFLLGGTAYLPAAPQPIFVSEVHGSSFTLSWQYVPDVSHYELTIEQAADDGTWHVLEGYDHRVYSHPEEVTPEDLSPLTEYRIQLTARLGSYLSAPAVAQVTTTEMEFFELRPTAIEPTDVCVEGFTARWLLLEQAEGYCLRLGRLVWESDGQESCDFHGGTESFPQDWSSSSTTFNRALFGTASPSLQLSSDNDELVIAHHDGKLSSISFWYRSQTSSNTLHVEQMKLDQWEEVDLFQTSTTGTLIELPLDTCDMVRLRLEKKSGYVVIDDVSVEIVKQCVVPVDGLSDIKVGPVLDYRFVALQPAQTYVYQVAGLQGSQRSRFSQGVQVQLPTDQNPTDPSSFLFSPSSVSPSPVVVTNLLGIRSLPFRGVNIVSDGRSVRKILRK